MNTTCKCGSTFGGRAQHCCACHLTFSGTSAGDFHRTGDHAISTGPNRRRCLTVEEMELKGMGYAPNSHGTPIWTRGAAGYKDGAPQNQWYLHAEDESNGLPAPRWGIVPLVKLEGLTETEVKA